MRVCLAVLSVLLLASCGGSKGDIELNAQYAALADARVRWADQGYNSYEVTFDINCFCPANSTGANILTVIDNRIVSATNVNTGMSYHDANFTGLYTVTESFDFIESLLDNPPDELVLEFDPTYGYPTLIQIDYIKAAADDEVVYGFSGLM